MKQRIIMGLILLAIFIASFVFKVFPLIVISLIIAGSYEWYQMVKKNHHWLLYGYLIIYVISLTLSIWIFYHNPSLLFISILMVIFNDSCAYFAGKFWGKHHFTKLSPNKTIEGLFGGLIGSAILTTVVLFLTHNLFSVEFIMLVKNPALNYIIYLVIVSILATIGDLFESMIKRFVKIKDTSNIFLGHGGVLDRIDSWLLVFIFIFIMLNI